MFCFGVQAKDRRPVEQILFRMVNGWTSGWADGRTRERSGGRAQSGWMVWRRAGGPARGRAGEWSGGRVVGGAVGRDILRYDKWL